MPPVRCALLLAAVLLLPTSLRGQGATGSTTPPVRAGLPGLPAKPTPPPHITAVQTPGTRTTPACLTAGSTYVLVGTGFRSAQGTRGVAAGGHGVHVALTVHEWGDTRILVSFPAGTFRAFEVGKTYYLAITDAGQWASDLTRTWQRCDPRSPTAR